VGDVMVPRLAVIVRDAQGEAKVPQTVTVGGQTRRVWSRFEPAFQVGGFPARELRDDAGSTLLVLVRLAQRTLGDGSLVVVVVVWTPADSTAAMRQTYLDILANFGADLKASWVFTLSGGVWSSAALQADNGAIATAIKTNWPTGPGWAASPPTLGAVLA
jgi:hypothetical protein